MDDSSKSLFFWRPKLSPRCHWLRRRLQEPQIFQIMPKMWRLHCGHGGQWTLWTGEGARVVRPSPATIALCGYPLVKMELEIQTRFLPRLPFSCNSIISDKIWRKMSLSLSIFLVLPQISLVKYYETIKILMQIFWYFRSHFHNVAGPGEKSYFEVFFSA